MLRSVLLLVLSLLVIRLVSRALTRVLGHGAAPDAQPWRWAQRPPESRSQSVHMMRDPVCGTFVVPERALPLSEGGRQLFFCSADCRDKYQSRPAEGRTA